MNCHTLPRFALKYLRIILTSLILFYIVTYFGISFGAETEFSNSFIMETGFAIPYNESTVISSNENKNLLIDTISHSYKLFSITDGNGLLKLKCGEMTIDSCRSITNIDGTERYIIYEDSFDRRFIFDAVTHKSSLAEHLPPYCTADFLTELPQGPLFYIGNILHRLDGIDIHIADKVYVDVQASRNNTYLYISSSLGLGRIEYRKLKDGMELYMDSAERAHIYHLIPNLVDELDYNSWSSLELSIPCVEKNPLLRQNILFWLSENIFEELTVYAQDFQGIPYKGLKMYVPTLSSTEDELAHYYAYMILQGFYEVKYVSDIYENDSEDLPFSQFWGGGFAARIEPMMENDNFVTLLSTVDSNFGAGTGFGACVIPVATFDKKTGLRLTIRDIIKEDNVNDFADYFRKICEDNWSEDLTHVDTTTLLSFPIGLLQKDIYINVSRHTFVGIGAELYLPYSSIIDWLKFRPSLDKTEVQDPIYIKKVNTRRFKSTSKEVDFYPDDEVEVSYKNSNVVEMFDRSSFQKYIQMIDSLVALHKIKMTNDVESILTVKSINGGINTVMANILMEKKDYGRAYDVYRLLCDKYGHNNPMGIIQQSFSGVLSSGVRYAAELIDANRFEEANEIIENIERLIKSQSSYAEIITQDYLFPKADIEILKSRINSRRGLPDLAEANVRAVFPTLQNHLKNTFLNISNKEREELWNHYSPWYVKFLLSLAAVTDDSLIKTYSYEAVLNGKGVLLNADIAIRKSIMVRNDSIAKQLLYKNDNLSAQLMMLISGKTVKPDDTEDKISYLKEELEKIRSELKFRLNSYANNIASLEMAFADVVNALNIKEVAIEFVVVDSEDFNMPPAYYAMVVNKGAQYPEMVFLGERDKIDKLACSESVYESIELYNIIWAPLLPLIKDASCIYFSPDGNLYTLALEYLPYDTNGNIISDLFTMKRLTSTRMIVRGNNDTETESYKRNRYGILYGGIDYDDTSHRDIANFIENEIAGDLLLPSSSSAPDYGFRTAFNDLFSRARVRPLKGTEEEVNNIKAYANDLKGIDNVILITGADASEESFKKLPEIRVTLLHIATHGFYFSEEELKGIRSQGLINSITSSEKDIDDIGLLRSGLMMAGANQTIRKNNVSDGYDDGILTAKEISMLNLFDIDLATLSACQTGLGEIDSDGVIGLQRGFKKAGVNSLLMSLWKVDDKATMVLMTEFYRQLSMTGNKITSLAAARKYLRSYDNGVFDHPFFWGAFILLDAL